MKIVVWCIGFCAIIRLEACFCKGKTENVLEVHRARSVAEKSPCFESLLSVKQSMLFFERLASPRGQARIDCKKRLMQSIRNEPFLNKKHDFSEHEEKWYKELREEFERGYYDGIFDLDKDHSVVVDSPNIPFFESEECVARRVIKELMPKKVFSRDQARECYECMSSWRAFIEAYGIGVPKDYVVTCSYLEKLLREKN